MDTERWFIRPLIVPAWALLIRLALGAGLVVGIILAVLGLHCGLFLVVVSLGLGVAVQILEHPYLLPMMVAIAWPCVPALYAGPLNFHATPLYWVSCVAVLTAGLYLSLKGYDARKRYNLRMKQSISNHTSEGIRQPADGSPKPSM